MTVTSSTLIFTKDSKSIKKPPHLKNEVLLIYAPKELKFPRAKFTKYNTEITVTLPRNSQSFFCSKYKDEIGQFLSIKQRPWIGILNKSFFDDIVIKNGQILKTDKRFTVKNEMKTTLSTT